MRAFVILVTISSLVACSDPDKPRTPLTIGLLMPLTGDLAAFGKEFSDAALLAVEDINQHGGVLDGREVQLTVKDTGTSPTGAMIGYNALANEHVDVVLGPAASSEVVALQSQIAAGSTLMLSPSSTSPSLSTLDFNGHFFRLAASDAVQSRVLADLINGATLTNLCLVIRNDTYGNGIAAALMTRLPTLSTPPTTIKVAKYEPSSVDISNALASCGMPDRSGSAKNGILFVSLIADGATLMDSASSTYGWDPAMGDRVFLTDGTRDADLLGLLTNRNFVEGAMGTASTGPKPGTPEATELEAFRAAFLAKFGRASDVYAEMAFDAAYVSAMALELAGGGDDIGAMEGALTKMSQGNPVSAGNWAAIKAELAAAGQLDYRGASGAVTFAPPSVDLAGPFYIEVWTITGGTAMQLEVREVPAS